MMDKWHISLLGIALGIIIIAPLWRSYSYDSAPAAPIMSKRSSVEKAHAATVRIDFKDGGRCTGFIVGRQSTGTIWKYYLATCYHCSPYKDSKTIIDLVDFACKVIRWQQTSSPELIATYLKLELSLPAIDLMIASFESSILIEPIRFSPKGYLDKMHLDETIFMIGGDLGLLPMLRRGVVGARRLPSLAVETRNPLRQHINDYFVPALDGFKGASGAPVINSDGDLIGMFQRIYRHGPTLIEHLTIAIKSDIILEWLKKTNSLHMIRIDK
jgi:hypothetical protein